MRRRRKVQRTKWPRRPKDWMKRANTRAGRHILVTDAIALKNAFWNAVMPEYAVREEDGVGLHRTNWSLLKTVLPKFINRMERTCDWPTITYHDLAFAYVSGIMKYAHHPQAKAYFYAHAFTSNSMLGDGFPGAGLVNPLKVVKCGVATNWKQRLISLERDALRMFDAKYTDTLLIIPCAGRGLADDVENVVFSALPEEDDDVAPSTEWVRDTYGVWKALFYVYIAARVAYNPPPGFASKDLMIAEDKRRACAEARTLNGELAEVKRQIENLADVIRYTQSAAVKQRLEAKLGEKLARQAELEQELSS
jgi:hypothetical protein